MTHCKNCGEPDPRDDSEYCETCWRLALKANGWQVPLSAGIRRGPVDEEARAELERRREAKT